MVQARYSDSQLRALDEARFCQKTDAINRRIKAVTHQFVSVVNQAYINAQSVCD